MNKEKHKLRCSYTTRESESLCFYFFSGKTEVVSCQSSVLAVAFLGAAVVGVFSKVPAATKAAMATKNAKSK
jgi:ATP-dependent Clp protease adapter protein ClpS